MGRKNSSSLFIFITSLIWLISNKAATLGIKFFPNVFAEAIICEYGSDNLIINGVKFSAKKFS